MKIALVLDNPSRDLSGLVLTGMHLCRLGCTCYLVPMNLQHWELWPLVPDFVLVNYLRDPNQDLARHLMDAGIGVGVLDTEELGLALSIFEADFDKFIAPDPAVRERISLYCSWGPVFAEEVVNKKLYGAKPMRVTGCPRYDFYAQPWGRVTRATSAHVDRFSRPMVLVNGTFPMANPAYQTKEQEAQMLIERFGVDEQVVRGYMDRSDQGMRKMARLVNDLSSEFQHVTIIYRPHPFEKMATYDDLLDPRPNVHVTNEGTVDGWIMRSAAVIQRGCSTAVDAVLAGVPSITPTWVPNAVIRPELDALSIACESEQDVFKAVRAALDERLPVPESVKSSLDDFIANWFFRNDGNAGHRVAQAIVETVSNHSYKPSVSYCEDAMHGRFNPGPEWKKRVRVGVSRFLGRSPHWSFRRWKDIPPDHIQAWDSSGKSFNVEQVQQIVDAIESVAREMNNDSSFSVRVRRAEDGKDYLFTHSTKRSIVMTPL